MIACEQNEIARPTEHRAGGEGDNHGSGSGLEFLLPHRLRSWCGVDGEKVGGAQGQSVNVQDVENASSFESTPGD